MSSAADMSRTIPEDPAKTWKRAIVVLQFIIVFQAVMMTIIANKRDDAQARAEVCLAAAKVDHVRVGEFVDKDNYQFCYSDADVDVCVFRKVTP